MNKEYEISENDRKIVADFLQNFEEDIPEIVNSFNTAVELFNERKGGYILMCAVVFREILDNFRKLGISKIKSHFISPNNGLFAKEEAEAYYNTITKQLSTNKLVIKAFLYEYVYFALDQVLIQEKNNIESILEKFKKLQGGDNSQKTQEHLNGYVHNSVQWKNFTPFNIIVQEFVDFLIRISVISNETIRNNVLVFYNKIEHNLNAPNKDILRIINTEKLQEYFCMKLCEVDKDGNNKYNVKEWFNILGDFLDNTFPYEAIKMEDGISYKHWVAMGFFERVLLANPQGVLEKIVKYTEKLSKADIPNIRIYERLMVLTAEIKKDDSLDSVSKVLTNLSQIVKKWQYSQYYFAFYEKMIELLDFLNKNNKSIENIVQNLLTLRYNDSHFGSNFFQDSYVFSELLKGIGNSIPKNTLFKVLLLKIVDVFKGIQSIEERKVLNHTLSYRRSAIETHTQNHILYDECVIIDYLILYAENLENVDDKIYNELLLKEYIEIEEGQKERIVLFERIALHLARKLQDRKKIKEFLLNKQYATHFLYHHEYYHLIEEGIQYLGSEDTEEVVAQIIKWFDETIEEQKGLYRDKKEYNEKNFEYIRKWRYYYPLHKYFNNKQNELFETIKDFCIKECGYNLDDNIAKGREHLDFTHYSTGVMVGNQSKYTEQDVENILQNGGISELITKIINHHNEITTDDKMYDNVSEEGFAQTCANVLVSKEKFQTFVDNLIEEFISHGEDIHSIYFSDIIKKINELLKNDHDLIFRNIEKLYKFVEYILKHKITDPVKQDGLDYLMNYAGMHCMNNIAYLFTDLLNQDDIAKVFQDNSHLLKTTYDILYHMFTQAKKADNDNIKGDLCSYTINNSQCIALSNMMKLFNICPVKDSEVEAFIVNIFNEIKNDNEKRVLLYLYGQNSLYWLYNLKWKWAIDTFKSIFSTEDKDWFDIVWIGCIEAYKPSQVFYDDAKDFYLFALRNGVNNQYIWSYYQQMALHIGYFLYWKKIDIDDDIIQLALNSEAISSEMFMTFNNSLNDELVIKEILPTLWSKRMNIAKEQNDYNKKDLEKLNSLFQRIDNVPMWLLKNLSILYKNNQHIHNTHQIPKKLNAIYNDETKECIKIILTAILDNKENSYKWHDCFIYRDKETKTEEVRKKLLKLLDADFIQKYAPSWIYDVWKN